MTTTTAKHGSRPSQPAVVEQGYQAWLWLDALVARFPRAARRELGARIADAALDALTATTVASVSPRGPAREAQLRLANRSLTVLRILARGARERRYMSIAQHEHGMRLVDDWGRQLGGWLRAEDRQQPRPGGGAAHDSGHRRR